MKYFCIAESNNKKHFFLSDIKPHNPKVEFYELANDDSKIFDLEKNISIINSSPDSPSTLHNLLFIYMLLSDLCIKESEKEYFNDLASTLALEQVSSSLEEKI